MPARVAWVLLGLWSCPESQAAEACAVKSQALVRSMPPLRKQDGTSFSFAFAATGLLQQHFCSDREARGGGPCRYGLDPRAVAKAKGDREVTGLIEAAPDDRLSVLDVAAAAGQGDENGESILPGVEMKRALETIAIRRRVAPESCAPFDRIVNAMPTQGAQQIGGYLAAQTHSWGGVLRQLYERYKDPGTPCPCQDGREPRARCFAQELKSVVDLQADVAQIQRALDETHFESFLKTALKSDACGRERIELPPFAVRNLVLPKAERLAGESSRAIEAGLDAVLSSAAPRPVAVNLCGQTTECGAHSLVVSGLRETCCGSACSREYRIYDSDETFGKNPQAAEVWVRREELIGRMVRAVSGGGPAAQAPVLTWIEPRQGVGR